MKRVDLAGMPEYKGESSGRNRAYLFTILSCGRGDWQWSRLACLKPHHHRRTDEDAESNWQNQAKDDDRAAGRDTKERCRELPKNMGNININPPPAPLRTTKERSIYTNEFLLLDVER